MGRVEPVCSQPGFPLEKNLSKTSAGSGSPRPFKQSPAVRNA
ncbi:MAG: hypothetical protein ACP5PQ_01055 [Thermoproteota archaeon]